MESTNFTNHFLIAMPSMDDPNFAHTVTYICVHNDEGAMGIIINRRLDLELGDVLSQMKIEPTDDRSKDMPVFNGGPVQPERGFIIYRPHHEWSSTLKVTEEISVATSRDILEAISRGEGPRDMLVALGYAGWGAGQLEEEMLANAWLSAPASEEILFDAAPQDRWRLAMEKLGVGLDHLSSQAGHS